MLDAVMGRRIVGPSSGCGRLFAVVINERVVFPNGGI